MKRLIVDTQDRCVSPQDNEQLYTFVTHPIATVCIDAQRNAQGLLITAITLHPGGRTEGPGHGKTADPLLAAFAEKIRSLLNGEPVCFNDVTLDVSRYTSFQKKVLAAARRIPRGTTVSYARLAQMAGYPRAVRAAASVMRNNRFPLVVPCHRVVKTDGTTGGFMGTQRGAAVILKRRLLDLER